MATGALVWATGLWGTIPLMDSALALTFLFAILSLVGAFPVGAMVALGAEAVILGRAPVYGLAAGGREGALKALEILQEELDTTLALTGCRSIADLSPDLLVKVD